MWQQHRWGMSPSLPKHLVLLAEQKSLHQGFLTVNYGRVPAKIYNSMPALQANGSMEKYWIIDLMRRNVGVRLA